MFVSRVAPQTLQMLALVSLVACAPGTPSAQSPSRTASPGSAAPHAQAPSALASPGAAATPSLPPSRALSGATAGAVEFAFGWRPGMEARVSRVSAERQNGTLAYRVADAWTLRVAEGPDATLRVEWSNPEVQDEADNARAVAVTLRTPYQLTSDGAFAGLSGDADRFIANFLASTRANNIGTQETAEARATLSSLQSVRVASDWALSVSNWVGGAYPLGEGFVAETNTQEVEGVGAVGGGLTFTVQERLPCPGAANRSCVRIHWLSRQSPQSVEAMMLGLLKKSMKITQKVVVRIDTFQTEGDLITEPATLTPYAVNYIKLVEGVITVDGKSHPLKSETEMQERYEWRLR